MTTSGRYPLLEEIESPRDIRGLGQERLPELADQLRAFLIDSVSQSGGHFAAGLGTVELTIALHYAFDTPRERLVWDVGHQTYPHKILTGRRDRIHTVRKRHGLSGFPRRSESPYDAFGVAHAGTSISAALGMVEGARTAGSPRRVVAVIGDGALSAGMALEALNHAGDLKSDLLVVLNDNAMSISPNVGALSRYLTNVLSTRYWMAARQGGKRILSRMPPMEEFARRAEAAVKSMLTPGALFEELGFQYFGPIDGHDVNGLVRTLKHLRPINGPRLLHVVTRKGKGYTPAENDPVAYHGVGPFDPQVGVKPSKSSNKPPSYTQVFGRWLCDLAARDRRLVAITPAMREGSGLVEFAGRYPERYYDVSIAEQHALTLAAGLACEGVKPVVAIYSTFLQRAYDQLIHDIALQNLDVLFAIDRAGLVGPDGPTHAGAFDLSYLRCVPNLVIMAPSDENEARQMLYTGFLHRGPAAVRYPRDTGVGVPVKDKMAVLPMGRAEVRRRGRSVAILAFGTLLSEAVEAAQQLDATVVNMRFVSPLDENAILNAANEHDLLVTLEDNAVAGGAGSAVNEVLAAHQLLVPVINMGLPHRFIDHGTRGELLAECGLDAAGIMRAVHNHFRRSLDGIRHTGTAP
ncbi:MAG TPA: 1-deoxy-D-xylulose-5-phosphate synthase [Gammaproteobacteria bacterium]|nr:1-deoxy-D-xylulose-5-phosphate synthase [Gammaproteobacteria bacterium]